MNDNWLLGDLAPECLEFLNEHVHKKSIAAGEILFEEGAPVQNLIFPIDGMVSVQCSTQDGRHAEVFAMGRDGAIGAHYLLGLRRFPCYAVTVISGRAIWIPVAAFLDAIERFPCVVPALNACLLRVFSRMAQNVLCASHHSAPQRIANWILHAQDRVERESFDLTQRALSDILGLRSATVSEAYNRLLSAGAIQHSRGNLQVVDREVLHSLACECYDQTHLDCLRKVGAAR
ncbi:MAG: Crp/Fnr family transcriptional regulator [Sphingomonadales bacterium]|nr:Crp/Fnr family transcriptional regulator [Sphingomonadales bacterium]